MLKKPNLAIQRFIYNNAVRRPFVSRALDLFGNAVNKSVNGLGLSYATGLTRYKAILFASGNLAEHNAAKKALLASNRKRAQEAVEYFNNTKKEVPKTLQAFFRKTFFQHLTLEKYALFKASGDEFKASISNMFDAHKFNQYLNTLGPFTRLDLKYPELFNMFPSNNNFLNFVQRSFKMFDALLDNCPLRMKYYLAFNFLEALYPSEHLIKKAIRSKDDLLNALDSFSYMGFRFFFDFLEYGARQTTGSELFDQIGLKSLKGYETVFNRCLNLAMEASSIIPNFLPVDQEPYMHPWQLVPKSPSQNLNERQRYLNLLENNDFTSYSGPFFLPVGYQTASSINPIYMDNRHMSKYVKGRKVLDIGCGRSQFVPFLREYGGYNPKNNPYCKAIGIDLNPPAKDTNPFVIGMSAYDIKFPDGTFDYIHESRFLELICDLNNAGNEWVEMKIPALFRILSEISRVLKTGGMFHSYSEWQKIPDFVFTPWGFKIHQFESRAGEANYFFVKE